MERETLLQHLGEETHYARAVTPPIFQTSLYVYEDCESFWESMFGQTPTPKDYIYSRMGNPNLTMVGQKIAALEGTESCLVMNSGMSAVSSAIMSTVRSGGHVVIVDMAYGPTLEFVTKYLPRLGVEHTVVTGLSTEDVFAACQENTQAIILESPSSILFRFQDLKTICEFAKSRGITTIHDNSYSSGFWQQPAAMGVDLVIHSATKFFAGHSDLVAGTICGSTDRIQSILECEAQWLGHLLAPFPAWLLLRGLRTLPLRMKHTHDQGVAMREWLRRSPWVDKVFCAGDPGHPQRELAQHMTGCSSLISFEPKCQDIEKLKAFLSALKIFQIGVSWGGFESLAIAYPAHPTDWPEMRWVIRLYCGLEHINDLCDDLHQAMRLHL